MEALSEAERGLTYYDVADLRLLAAILSEETGRYDQMRNHVAAIPVDDSYRSEAEWLLRAHQERQSKIRKGAKQERYSALSTQVSPELADILGFDTLEESTAARKGAQVWTLVAIIMILIVIPVTWFGARELSAISGDYRMSGQTEPIAQEPITDADNDAALQPASPDSPSQAVDSGQAVVTEDANRSAQDVQFYLIPTPTPDATSLTEPGAMADSNPRSVVVLSASSFDLERYFRSTNNAELAELPLEARLQGDKLIVSGVVYLDVQRRRIVDLLEAVPGVNSVSTADLLLRPKDSYTVQEGDTLWSIVFDIYGNYDRVDELYRYNLGTATSPDSIKPGDTLKVPVLE